jgi:hypothetical protein
MANLKILLITIIFLFTTFITAQTNTEGLVITEVHLTKDSPELNWIKIYNPEPNYETLGQFRVSHIRTPNLLPNFNGEKKYEFAPGETLIFCVNIDKFEKHWNYEGKIVEIPVLGKLTEGGFIAISKNIVENEKFDLVRYGNPAASMNFRITNNYDVVPFSINNKTYTRKATKEGAYFKFGNWE